MPPKRGYGNPEYILDSTFSSQKKHLQIYDGWGKRLLYTAKNDYNTVKK